VRALVLSGGGTRGSWQAGAVRYLSEAHPEGFHFITGSSVGGLVAAGLAMFPPEQVREGARFVEKIWHDDINASLWRLRFPLGLPGLFRRSFGRRDGMEALIRARLDPARVRASGIQLRLPTVDLCSGQLIVFDENSPDLVEGVLASSAFPVVFPPIQDRQGRLLTDGGVRDFAPLKAAIEAGADSITVLLTEDPKQLSQVPAKKLGSALQIAERTLRIVFHELMLNDIYHCSKLNALIDEGHLKLRSGGPRRIQLQVIVPSRPLGPGLDFSTALLHAQLQQGYDDARAAL
jgi:NTE family protein